MTFDLCDIADPMSRYTDGQKTVYVAVTIIIGIGMAQLMTMSYCGLSWDLVVVNTGSQDWGYQLHNPLKT